MGLSEGPRIVFVRIEETRTSWWLDPQSLQRVGSPNERRRVMTANFVLEEGKWKVREAIEEPA